MRTYNDLHRACSMRLLAGLLACSGLALAACWQPAAVAAEMTPDCNPDSVPQTQRQKCLKARLDEGRRLFEEEIFGGNGRTCLTCHSRRTGTLSPREVRKRLKKDPMEPLFLHDGLDDGYSGTSRIASFATIRVTRPLPWSLSLKDSPATTEVTLNRGIPTTLNTPALDPALMYDYRDPNLEAQALGAVISHAQPPDGLEPLPLELELIAEFQRSDPRFFSDGRLRKWMRTGTPPALPEGTTASELRGREFFVDAPFNPPDKRGLCALCHSGPFLNQTNAFAFPAVGSPPGSRPQTAGVSERNKLDNPVYTFLIHDGQLDADGVPKPPVEVASPDLGVLMTEPGILAAQGVIPPVAALPFVGGGIRLAFFANRFKTPTLWGVKRTAPYFHDNSAADLNEMLDQYDWFFANPDLFFKGSIELTDQDKEDIKAFLKLL